MDQRTDPRLRAEGPAKVTVLGEAKRQIEGRAAGLSGRGLNLVLKEAAPAGTALMVEWEDSEVLGDVVSCESCDGGFAVTLQIEHALVGTRELARLASRLLGEEEPNPVRHL